MEKSKIAPQLIAGIAASLSTACAGFVFGWPSPSLPKLLAEDSDIPITSDQSSWIVSFATFGATFGPLISVFLVDKCGRKMSLLLTVIPYLIGAILIGAAQGYWWFIAGRFIAGLSCGMSFAIGPMYLGEIAEDKIRGALGAFLGFITYAALLLTYCVGPWVDRVGLAGLGAALPLTFGLIFVWMPESPYYLLMKGKTDCAEKSLSWLRGTKSVAIELKKIQDGVEFDRKNPGTVRDIVMIPGNRKALIVVLGLILAQQCSGINAILAYISLIFGASGSALDSNISAIIVGGVQLLSGLLPIFVVDLAGRRILLLLSIGGSIIFLSGEALYFQLQAMGTDVSAISWIPVTAIVGFMIFFAIGLGPLPYVVTSEIFPYNMKALASTASAMTGALSGMVIAKFYQVIADAFGIHASFWVFVALSVFWLFFIYIYLPETKQRSLKTIQEELHKTTDSTMVLEKSESA